MIRAIIIDDEIKDQSSLKNILAQFQNVQVIGSYKGNEININEIAYYDIHAVFLETEMKTKNGMQLAQSIATLYPDIHIIFVTNNINFAIPAFEMETLDYLLKPVTIKRLTKTIDRLTRRVVVSQKSEKDLQRYTIHCFNEFQFLKDGIPLSFKTSKVKEMLAYFILFPNTPIHRDLLIKILWPEHNYNKSKVNLHTCVSHLRKMLADHGFNHCIQLVNESYIFSIENIWIDLYQFQQNINSIESVTEQSIENANQCIELYKGHLFHLNQFHWAKRLSIRYTLGFANLLDQIIEYYSENDLFKMIYYLNILLSLYPYNDDKVKQYMNLLFKHGYRNEAIKLYIDYKKRLEDELKIAPSQSLKSLYDKFITLSNRA